MNDLKQWIDNRGVKGEEYLGNLCKEKHEYLDTAKSVRCKPTDRPNGKCVCCGCCNCEHPNALDEFWKRLDKDKE